MVSKAFFTGSKYLVEENDGRNDVVRYDGERFLAVLSTAGRKVLGAPLDADDRKTAYLKALVRINERYFDAREFEARTDGKFFKHDDDAERKLRFDTARRLSDAVADLRALLAAHDALVEATVEDAQVADARGCGERGGSDDPRRALAAVRSTLLTCTDRSIAGGWFPVVRSYYYALSPGELVAEGRERRNQRIEGTENSTGIARLLDRPHFEKLSERDLRRVRELNRESGGPDARVWKDLHEDYRWFLTSGRAEAATATSEDE